MMHERLTAVVWDFDGTLVDTRRKNMNVTRALVERIKGSPADDFPALRSLADYERALHRHRHWRDFYCQELQMQTEDTDAAEELWLQYQLDDTTAAETYAGIHEVLEAFGHLPQGIVSLNMKPNILRFLEDLELSRHFDHVLGNECVDQALHKPHPYGLIRCIDELTGMAPGLVIYIGDHETDVECACNANVHFRTEGTDLRVLSVGALYAPYVDDDHWTVAPDTRAFHPAEIVTGLAQILESIP